MRSALSDQKSRPCVDEAETYGNAPCPHGPRLYSFDLCFTGADAARLLTIVGLPRIAGLDDDQAALQLNAVVADMIGAGRFQRELPKPTDKRRQLRSIEGKSKALLDALDYCPDDKDPQQFSYPLMKPYHSLLSPRPGDHNLPRWVGTGLGLLPRFADLSEGDRKNALTFIAEHPDLGSPEPTPASLESDAIAAAASNMLAEFPRYLKIVAIMADMAACRIKNPGAAGNAGLKKSARPINVPRAILFQGLVRLHLDAFGCWPKVTRDVTGERNRPAVRGCAR